MSARAECNAQGAPAAERSVAYTAEVQLRVRLRQLRWMHLIWRWDCNSSVPCPPSLPVLSWKCTISGALMIQQKSILPTRALPYLLHMLSTEFNQCFLLQCIRCRPGLNRQQNRASNGEFEVFLFWLFQIVSKKSPFD